MIVKKIEFRGLREDGKGFVYGSLIGKDVIVGKIVDFEEDYFTTEFWYKVKLNTIGMYWKNFKGKKLYEGDIIKVTLFTTKEKEKKVFYQVVKFNKDYGFEYSPYITKNFLTVSMIEDNGKIVGNIHNKNIKRKLL